MEPLPGLHVRGALRDPLGIPDDRVAASGAVFVPDPASARDLAHRLSLRRGAGAGVAAGEVAAVALIGEITRRILLRYCRATNPGVLGRLLDRLAGAPGSGASLVLAAFTREFPPVAVHRGLLDAERHLALEHGGVPNRHTAVAELILLRLANENAAFAACRELFDEAVLSGSVPYRELLADIEAALREEPTAGPGGATILDLLRAPALASPDSLAGQLEYLLASWRDELAPYLSRLLTAQDILREESRPGFVPGGRAATAGPGLGLASASAEWQRYTPDRDWMPNVVMLAKLAHVWLHQLSVSFGRPVERLDDVPDEELDRIAAAGFTALWLIGVWERSPASEEIKRRRGNPDAAASAYSLYDYEIAADLGGWEALDRLRHRARARGVRLAADMVPNHTGIWSRWIVEHPDWFVQLPRAPFPVYRFGGPDLSRDDRVGIFLEEGYWAGTDAAVVFRRLDRWTGEERFVYHGNDGTGLPWNDTAQLNFLLPEVRAAVLETILHVARHFPIIRFDAAMTLTKRHYQRLWFPPPGHGGAIPSRAEHGIPADAFHAAMPEEFWREVVDRVNAEAPDTLLLAEAFWLLEGFFVRTLGMHRVYNSAFMNMLAREENAKYRAVLKDVLLFDPEVLKRFVNFMNNPDEETAVAQFGKGDKYFGTAVMLATLPGLPMFGHGQLEGFSERYGMEFRRAYRDEPVDSGFLSHHGRVIFPLLRRRHLFSGSDRFALYDVVDDGGIRENVFAYSNGADGETALVIFNNGIAQARGWIRTSAPRVATGPESATVTRDLAGEIGAPWEADGWLRFRDIVTGLEYLRSGRELHERGLFVDLPGFGHHAFVDFAPVRDGDGTWAALAARLRGRGDPSLDTARRALALAPVHRALDGLLAAVRDDPRATEYHERAAVAAWDFLSECLRSGEAVDPAAGAVELLDALVALDSPAACGVPGEALLPAPAARAPLAVWLALRHAGDAALADRLLLPTAMRRLDPAVPHPEIAPLLPRLAVAPADGAATPAAMATLLADPDARTVAGVNSHGGTVWFSREGFGELVRLARIAAALPVLLDSAAPGHARVARLAAVAGSERGLVDAAAASGYRLEVLLAMLTGGGKDGAPTPAGSGGV